MNWGLFEIPFFWERNHGNIVFLVTMVTVCYFEKSLIHFINRINMKHLPKYQLDHITTSGEIMTKLNLLSFVPIATYPRNRVVIIPNIDVCFHISSFFRNNYTLNL